MNPCEVPGDCHLWVTESLATDLIIASPGFLRILQSSSDLLTLDLVLSTDMNWVTSRVLAVTDVTMCVNQLHVLHVSVEESAAQMLPHEILCASV